MLYNWSDLLSYVLDRLDAKHAEAVDRRERDSPPSLSTPLRAVWAAGQTDRRTHGTRSDAAGRFPPAGVCAPGLTVGECEERAVLHK